MRWSHLIDSLFLLVRTDSRDLNYSLWKVMPLAVHPPNQMIRSDSSSVPIGHDWAAWSNLFSERSSWLKCTQPMIWSDLTQPVFLLAQAVPRDQTANLISGKGGVGCTVLSDRILVPNDLAIEEGWIQKKRQRSSLLFGGQDDLKKSINSSYSSPKQWRLLPFLRYLSFFYGSTVAVPSLWK